jgi:photosystem II stability/assembly factor-like uncharacterized protein
MKADGTAPDPAALLRAGLVAEAANGKVSSDLADRIIAQATAPLVPLDEDDELGRRRRSSQAWRGWVLPLVAAVGIAILVGSAVAAVRLVSSRDSTGNHGPSPTASVPVAPLKPSPTAHTSTGPSATPSGSGHPSAAQPGPSGPVPPGFTAFDLTWVSLKEGWALGTAPCATAPCTSLLRTTDGGKTWVGIHPPVAELTETGSCATSATPCVSSLRFANAEVGYAFGPNALFMTVDAGSTWQRQPGSALSLEIADGTALRLSSLCEPGCPLTVQSAPVGTDNWTAKGLPQGGRSASGELVRVGSEVLVADYGNPAGGASNETSVLFVSTDDGSHWSTIAEPCPQGTVTGVGENDTRAVTIAPDSSISVLCVPRAGQPSAVFTMTSTDHGAHFSRASSSPGTYGAAVVGAASRSALLVSVSDGLFRTADGGASWAQVSAAVSYLGFESPLVGHALPADASSTGSSVVLQTVDGGAHWASYPFN